MSSPVGQQPSLVVFGHTPPDMHFMQFHRDLAQEFGRRGWTVVWVSPPCVHKNPRWWLSDLGRRVVASSAGGWRSLRRPPVWLLRQAWSRLHAVISGSLERDGAIWDFRPWGLELVRHPGFRPLDELALSQLRRALRRSGVSRPVVLLTAVQEEFFAQRLDRAGIAFWVGDGVLAQAPGRAHEINRAMAEGVIGRADLVLAVSPVNFELVARRYPEKSVRVSTGISLRRVAEADLSMPGELAGLRRPLVGYTGSIRSDRFDLPLLLAVAKEVAEATFVLVGPIEEALAQRIEAEGSGNLLVLGARSYGEVLRYVEAFDVGLIPYLQNDFNLGSDPLKVYEYLVLGKPVVSVPLPAIEELGSAVLLAEDREGFAVQIRRALVPGPPAEVQLRRGVAAEHSVEGIVAQLAEVFERF